MEVAAAAQLAMTMKRAELSQALSTEMLKQSLQQDVGALQIIAAATQPAAQAASPPTTPNGRGLVLDIMV